jgi:VWFA-related protein
MEYHPVFKTMSFGAPVLSIAFAVFASCPASAQAAPTPLSPTTAEPSRPPILISARNKDGSAAELSTSEIEVKLDGKTTAVSELRRLPRPALQYCLLFDSSGSQRAVLELQREQATQFLSKIPQPGRDYGRFVAFSDKPYLDAEGTDPQKLIRALTKENARGATALYDSMAACSDELSKAAPDAFRLMLLLSDGGDDASHLTRDATIQILVKAQVRVFAIGRGEERGAVTALKQFAEATGGKNYSAWKKGDLENALADISGELDSLFGVTLAPATSPRGDGLHKIELKYKGSKKDISLSAPRKYCAPAQ